MAGVNPVLRLDITSGVLLSVIDAVQYGTGSTDASRPYSARPCLHIEELCSSACLLSDGQIVGNESPENIVQRYLAEISSTAPKGLDGHEDGQGTGDIRFVAVSLDFRGGHFVCCGQGLFWHGPMKNSCRRIHGQAHVDCLSPRLSHRG